MQQYKTLKQAYSKQPVVGYVLGDSNQSVFPDFNLDVLMNIIREDTVASGALEHFVDKCMEGDYAIIRKDTGAYDLTTERNLESKFKFRNDVLRKIFFLGKLFKNVFVEVITVNNETKAVNVCDTTVIEPHTKPNGDVLYFSTRPTADTVEQRWEPSEMFWIKFNDVSRGWAPINASALWETLWSKKFVTRFVAWLFETGQYRLAHNLKNSSKTDIESFLAYNSKVDRNFRLPILAKGEYEVKVLRDMKELENADRLLKYYDSQILIHLRIPPIDAGIPDASGRSNADAQSNSLSTHITSSKKIVEDAISYELFPRINKSESLFRFAPNDRFAEKQIYEVAQIMQSIGMKKEVIAEYLFDKGIVFQEDELFEDPVELAADMAEATNVAPALDPNKTDNPRNKDMAPSRMGKGTGEGNKKQAEKSTRSDQLRKE